MGNLWFPVNFPLNQSIDNRSQKPDVFCFLEPSPARCRHADVADRCWCWGDMICLGISWSGVTAVGWAQLVTPRQSTACQELRADNDELRRQNAELEAKDWGWIGVCHPDASGWDSHYFPVVSTCRSSRWLCNSMISPLFSRRKKERPRSSGQASRLRASHSNSKSFKQSRKSRMDDIMWRSPPKSATKSAKQCHADHAVLVLWSSFHTRIMFIEFSYGFHWSSHVFPNDFANVLW